MSSKVRLISAVAIALIAASALASEASAKQFHSGSAVGTTYVTGSPMTLFKTDFAGPTFLECSNAAYRGSYVVTTASLLTLQPIFAECFFRGVGFKQQSTIDTQGCHYTLSTPTQTVSNDDFDGTLKLDCKSGLMILTLGDPVVVCSITFGPQTSTGTVDYVDETTAPKDIRLTWTTSNTYTSTGSLCGPSGTSPMTGMVTLRAYSNTSHTSQVDLWIA